MNVTGGKLSGKIFNNDTPTACAITISGGYFDYKDLEDDSETWADKEWLAEGYRVYSNKDKDTQNAYPYVVTAEKKTVCTYTVSLTANADAQVLLLGGKEAGEFTVSGNNKKGFTLENAEGKFVSYAEGTLNTESDTAFIWKYDGGLYVGVKNTQAVKKSSGWLRWLYGSCKTETTTRYYLTVESEELTVTTTKTAAAIQVTDTEHIYTYNHDGDGMHEAICTRCGYAMDPKAHVYDQDGDRCICGKINPAVCRVTDIEVTEKQVKSSGGWRWTGWGRKTSCTKFRYTISPVTENVSVKQITYSLDGNSFTLGSSFTNAVKLDKFYIRVTDSYGNVTDWVYENCDVVPVN